jgi:KDO2-lipid IV(A) lauroyltransferase
MLKKLRRLSAYLLIRALVSAAEMLPRGAGAAFFAKLGAAAYFLFGKSRAIALANLDLVYGHTLSDKDIRRIAKAAFVNLGRFAYDVARLRRETPGSIKRIVAVRGQRHLDRALAGGKGVIVLSGHIGNWELLGAYLSMMGYPVTVLATRIKDSRLNDLLTDLRRSAGLKVVERSRGLRQAFRCLRKGEILGVLIDQDTSVQSVVVDFMGEPTKTAIGPVRLAARTGAPIVPLAMLMNEEGKYEVEVSEPVSVVGGDSGLEHDVENCSKAVERFIQKEPTQWVWMHKRWKSVKSDLYQ